MCPRKAATETRVYCDNCNGFTPTTGPIVVKRKKKANYYLKAVCGACSRVKPFKHLNMRQVLCFPQEIRDMPENSETTAEEPPAALNQIQENNYSGKIIEAIELLEQHGFTVIVK